MPKRAVLVLHPHPRHGGSMANKVVTTVVRAAKEAGLPAVAFNFRGVGQSQGQWDEGRGEVLDALSVAAALQAGGVEELMVAGFSFGAAMAAKLMPLVRAELPRLTPVDLLQIAPAVVNFPIDADWVHGMTPCVIFNWDDEVVSAEAMAAYATRLGVSPVVSDQGGHFFHGHLVRLKQAVLAHWADRGLS